MPFTQDSIFDTYPHKDMMNYVVKEYERVYFRHYDTEACALNYLSDFVQWLKENGIYDNTQIFVVSDHSGFDDIGIPYSVSQKGHRPVSLFLFKDFNTSGKLKLDSRLMANYDSPSMFCDNLPNGCPNVPKNILSNYPKNRNIISTIPIHWDISLHKKNEWLINHYFQVKGNVYDKSSWQDITESVKNGTFKIDGIEH
ncbi:alkaline phosphatase family protein [Helicobacter magdeburgensis]|uniref:alkaline phosphatase family protein n=1 Tax=Helicobacter magdeburgensis TaxID=471858 RepID=UPI000B1204C2|nr:alkaline phosphatase family protein [Helicobacter magdeburgensis]